MDASPNTTTPVTAPRKKAKRGPRPKHVPQRTCIACRSTAPKRSFIRIVRLPTGEVEVDPTGKKSGRGASLCGQRGCWTKALAGGLLDRALRVTVSEAARATLEAFAATLPLDEPGTPASADDEPVGGVTHG